MGRARGFHMQDWFAHARLRMSGIHGPIAGERGATAVEYAIMLAFIAAVVIAAVTALGLTTAGEFSKVAFP